MKRKLIRRLRYIVAVLTAVLVGLVIAKAVIVDAETDDFIQETDAFIERMKNDRRTYRPAHKDTVINDDNTFCDDDTNDWYSSEEVTDELSEVVISPEEFQVLGVIDWGEWRYTYYSEQVLPGEGLQIPGRWSDGTFVRDENGYLCVASNEVPYGSVMDTPFGQAIVYDSIGDGVTGICDIYVSFN